MRTFLLLAMLAGAVLIGAGTARADEARPPEPLITFELTGVTLRSVIETAFRGMGEPFRLPTELPNAKVAYISVKQRPIQRAIEMAYRSAGENWKGLTVVKRDGKYEMERRRVESAGLELGIPPVGGTASGQAGLVSISISVLREIELGKLEVVIETIAPKDTEFASSYHAFGGGRNAQGVLVTTATKSETRGISPLFQSRTGRALELEPKANRSAPTRPGQSFLTGILTVDPNDPPKTVAWELFSWRN